MGRRGGQLVAGICLAAAGVLAIIGLHWGHVIGKRDSLTLNSPS
jgi:hypothetical protein